METLALRMRKHSENALALAQFLESHPKVAWVSYPGLESHKDHELAKRYLSLGASGLLTFGVKGGRKEAGEFIRNIDLVSLVVHLGDVRTSVLHPATTTHRQLTDEELRAAGIGPEMIRVSVGIEDTGDIIEDFRKALGE